MFETADTHWRKMKPEMSPTKGIRDKVPFWLIEAAKDWESCREGLVTVPGIGPVFEPLPSSVLDWAKAVYFDAGWEQRKQLPHLLDDYALRLMTIEEFETFNAGKPKERQLVAGESCARLWDRRILYKGVSSLDYPEQVAPPRIPPDPTKEYWLALFQTCSGTSRMKVLVTEKEEHCNLGAPIELLIWTGFQEVELKMPVAAALIDKSWDLFEERILGYLYDREWIFPARTVLDPR